jgi:hypothetical protein
MTIKIEQTLVFDATAIVDIEDSGRAMIVQPVVISGEDPHFFLRFQSWDEDDRKHPLLKSLMGKKFRVIIEELPE